MNKRVTIKDVAARAGVSHPTVSRVIHDDPQISESTKKRVRRMMDRMGYRPNLIARGLVRSRTQVFALVIPDFNPHVQPIVRGVVDACRRRDYALMLFSTEYWSEEEASYSYIADNWRVDGVLIYNVAHHDRLTADAQRLKADRLPFVFINKYLRKKNINSVSVDNYEAVNRAVEHLAGLGHRRIGILNGSLMSVDGVERFEAFKEALARAKLRFDPRFAGTANFSDVEAAEEVRRILMQKDRPTAIFCANDLMAMGAIRAARRMKLRVPQDVSFVGFDDLEAGQWFNPALSTLRPPQCEVGEQAVELLVNIIRDPKRKPEQVGLSAKFIPRESSGPAS